MKIRLYFVLATLLAIGSILSKEGYATITLFAQVTHPNGIAVDQHGYVYVQSLSLPEFGGGLYKFQPDGTLLNRNPEFFREYRLAADAVNNVIWALETEGMLYVVNPDTLQAQPYLNVKDLLPAQGSVFNILKGSYSPLAMIQPRFGDIAIHRTSENQLELFITGQSPGGGNPFVVRLHFQGTSLTTKVVVTSISLPTIASPPPLDTQPPGIAVNNNGTILTVLPKNFDFNRALSPFFLATFDANFPESNINPPIFVPAFADRQVFSIGMTDSAINKGFYFVTVAQGLGCGAGPAVIYTPPSLNSIKCVADLSGLGLGIMGPNDIALSQDNDFLYITMSANNLVLRIEESPDHTLTVTKAGTGSGTVTSNPTGIDCGVTCSASFANNASVTLNANPAGGSIFAGWSGACTGTGSCLVAMNAARNVTATFDTANPGAVQSLITQYYQSILGRVSDSGGLAYWQGEMSRLQGLGVDVQEAFRVMAGWFFTSAEYLGRNTGDAQYVTDLYRTFFQRAPDAGGLGFWTGQLAAGMPRAVALYSFLFSAEFGSYMRGLLGDTVSRGEVYAVVDFYRGFLNRLPDPDGFNYWLSRFRAAQCQGAAAVNAEVESISGQFAASGEYANRKRSNRDYVGDLYYAFLRRGGELSGFDFWVSQLDNGLKTREQLRQEFLKSPEFQSRVQQIVGQGCLR